MRFVSFFMRKKKDMFHFDMQHQVIFVDVDVWAPRGSVSIITPGKFERERERRVGLLGAGPTGSDTLKMLVPPGRFSSGSTNFAEMEEKSVYQIREKGSPGIVYDRVAPPDQRYEGRRRLGRVGS